MTCGDLGHRNVRGEPCGAWIGPKARGCPWHIRTPEERKALSVKGNLMAQLKAGLVHPEPGTRYTSIEAVDKLVDETLVELRRNVRKPQQAAAILKAVETKVRLAEIQLFAKALGVTLTEIPEPNGHGGGEAA